MVDIPDEREYRRYFTMGTKQWQGGHRLNSSNLRLGGSMILLPSAQQTGILPFSSTIFLLIDPNRLEYSAPSTVYGIFMMCGKAAPSNGPVLIGFVFTFSHHYLATETTVPMVSLCCLSDSLYFSPSIRGCCSRFCNL